MKLVGGREAGGCVVALKRVSWDAQHPSSSPSMEKVIVALLEMVQGLGTAARMRCRDLLSSPKGEGARGVKQPRWGHYFLNFGTGKFLAPVHAHTVPPALPGRLSLSRIGTPEPSSRTQYSLGHWILLENC